MSSRCVVTGAIRACEAPTEGPDRRHRSVFSLRILAFSVHAFLVSCKQLVSCISWVKDLKKEKLPLCMFVWLKKEGTSN